MAFLSSISLVSALIFMIFFLAWYSLKLFFYFYLLKQKLGLFISGSFFLPDIHIYATDFQALLLLLATNVHIFI
jgi:hypothetical protein